MKFWLRKPGTSDFTGPLTLDEIRAQIQSGSIAWDFEALEASGQSHGALKRSTDWVALSSVCSPESVVFERVNPIPSVALSSVCSPESVPAPQAHDPTAEQEQSPLAFLEAVRCRTCYAALRDMIGLFTVLSIIAIVILAGFYVVVGLQSQSALPVVIGVVVGVLGCFLVIASKQASLLLIDIADTLIEQNRKKRRDTE